MDDVFQKILNEYKDFGEVCSIAVGGSGANGTNDFLSDIDVYVFVNSQIPVSEREKLITKYSSDYEVGGEYFGSGDEYFVNKMNKQLDVMYWDKNWFSDITENVWIKHNPSNGYTTAFLFTLSNFKIVYDKDNWLNGLQNSIKTPFPEKLKNNIIKRNIMLLKDKPFASYYEQIKKAIQRKDLNSINHRIAAFMASYFDVIFARNELLHPGEKRLTEYAKNNCKYLPVNFEENINKLLTQPADQVLAALDDIIENLKRIL